MRPKTKAWLWRETPRNYHGDCIAISPLTVQIGTPQEVSDCEVEVSCWPFSSSNRTWIVLARTIHRCNYFNDFPARL